jgi:hypothetical protein
MKEGNNLYKIISEYLGTISGNGSGFKPNDLF